MATILLLYLLAVVVVGVAGTPGSAAVAAVSGFLLVNWFYVPPYHTFSIGRPTTWWPSSCSSPSRW